MIFRINLKLRLIVLLKSLFYKLNKKDTSKLNHFFLKRTNKKALKVIDLDILKDFAIDLS